MPSAGTGKASAPQTVSDLDNLLSVVNNSMTITSGTLSNSLIGEVLAAFNDKNPLQLLNAVKQVNSDGVTITGTTSLLGATGVTITATFKVDGDFTLIVTVPATGLTALLAPVSGLKLPQNFDVSLPKTWGIIEGSGGQLTFIAAASGSIGEVLFQATQGTSWNAVAGLDLQIQKLADLPALQSSPLAAFDNFVGLADIMMVLSSQALPDFNFPDVDQFNAPDVHLNNIKLPDQASGLVQGLNIYANLSTANSKPFQLLAKYLNLKLDGSLGITLSVSLPNPNQSSKLFVSVQETITNGLVVDGMVGGILENGVVGIFMTGTAQVSIQKQPVVFSVTALGLETGVLIEGSMQNQVPIHFSFEGVTFQLSDVALLIGIDDEEIPSFGFAATVGIGGLNGSAAVLADSTNPSQSMFLGAISGIKLYDVVETIAGQQNVPSQLVPVLQKIALKGLTSFTVPSSSATAFVNALDARDLATIASSFHQYGSVTIPTSNGQVLLENNKKGLWYLTDLTQMMHYEVNLNKAGAVVVSLEPQIQCVPQRTTIGTLQFPQGLKVIGELDLYVANAKVEIDVTGPTGVLADATLSKITIGNSMFFALTSADGSTGPELSIATFTQSAQAQPDPMLQPPHIFISGSLTVLGQVLSSTYLSVSENGLVVDIQRQVSAWLNLTLNGTIGGLNNMEIGGLAVVGVTSNLTLGNLGVMPFDDNISCSLNMGMKSGTAYATLDGAFDFAGSSLKIAQFNLDVNTSALPNLVATLVPKITAAVVSDLQNSAQLWLSLARKGAILAMAAVQQAAAVLRSEFNEAAAQASQLLSAAGYSAGEISSVLKSVYGLSVQDAATVLKGTLNIGDTAAAQLLSAAGYSLNDVSSAMKSVYGLSVQDAATVLKGTLNIGDTAAAQLLSAAGYSINDVSSAMKSVYELSAGDASSVLKQIPGISSDAINSALGAAGYAESDIKNLASKGISKLKSIL